VFSNTCDHHDFRLVELASPEESIRLSFAVKNRNMDKLYEVLNDVSDPNSKNYGQHLTFEQIGELTSNREAHDQVLSFLDQFVTRSQVVWSPLSNFIEVDTDVKTANKLLKGTFQKFHSKDTGRVITRMLEFELPEGLEQVLDYVSPTVQFSISFRSPIFEKMTEKQTEKQTDLEVTPKILKKYYNITSNKVKNPKATQSVYADLKSFYPKDLTQFQETYNVSKDQVDNFVNDFEPNKCGNIRNCMEASLDLEYIMGIAQLAPTTFWNGPHSLTDWISQVASSKNVSLVHSVSYGFDEASLTESEQQRFSEEAAKLGTRGITVVISSGDAGVGGIKSTKGTYCGFRPDFPANVPYVLSVGATMGTELGIAETACEADRCYITSGGGFSEIFPQPDYQKKVVNKYLSNSEVTSNKIFPSQKMFNSKGRAYPDVSFAGCAYRVICKQTVYRASGTSASAPAIAAILTLANNARLEKGKSPLGFVNPALYELFQSNPSVFNDITKGSNECSIKTQNGTIICCDYGFPTAKGFDPVTGLGSVNVGRFVEALSGL